MLIGQNAFASGGLPLDDHRRTECLSAGGARRDCGTGSPARPPWSSPWARMMRWWWGQGMVWSAGVRENVWLGRKPWRSFRACCGIGTGAGAATVGVGRSCASSVGLLSHSGRSL